MADSTCVMHPFSYSKPPFSNDTHEESAMYGIGESISFGRYVSEEIEWEKWSSFEDNNNNRNRYVKEAEKYSKPGSVAQKKAYFEAHFKRMAALKAAALLEQANAENGGSSYYHVDPSSNLVGVDGNDDFEQAKNDGNEGVECGETGLFVGHQNEVYLTCANDLGNVDEIGGKDVDLNDVNQKLSDKIKVYSASFKVDDFKASNDEQPLLQENLSTKKETSASTTTTKTNPPLSCHISSEVDASKRTSTRSSPAKSANLIHPGKENYATPVKKKSSVTDPDKKRTPLRMSINREFNRIISPVIKKLGSSSKTSTPSKVSVSTPQHPSMTPDLMRRGASPSPRSGRNKISSPIIPNSFCLNGDRTERRKQKLEDKFNATTTEKPPQPSKFKIKAEAELNKFRQSFCFKTMTSPDYYGEDGTFRSPKQKNEAAHRNTPNGGGRLSNRTSSQNTSALPPRKPALNQKIGLKSKRTTPS